MSEPVVSEAPAPATPATSVADGAPAPAGGDDAAAGGISKKAAKKVRGRPDVPTHRAPSRRASRGISVLAIIASRDVFCRARRSPAPCARRHRGRHHAAARRDSDESTIDPRRAVRRRFQDGPIPRPREPRVLPAPASDPSN